MPLSTTAAPFAASEQLAAYRRMEARLLAGRPPSHGDLTTLWESYQAAVLAGGMRGEDRLPDDLVAELKADHDALVRALSCRAS